ncbi:MAG: peptide chain release factor N(5)-glutamine methyltransferase [Clostridium sp.]|nr:peptide chain release factor N(5)-glutamine methyltransferase [Prevotella sp.]MCM1429582.1 peptide chain release factor N(5)-glutamine methyltransferase [Clostridium sp.]MCM1476011.1 peptide chain release factor N(5)-glutamine methyltransferase [Muribaculaceae bacterium]
MKPDIKPNITEDDVQLQTSRISQPTLQKVIRGLRHELTPIYGYRESEAMIRLMFENLKGWDPVDIIINENKPVSEYLERCLNAIVDRLRKHEPIQYILGEAYFYGMNFKVKPGVLIPRPETEELVDMIVSANKESDLRVLDVATGSGCIAIALSRNLLFPIVDAFDLSETAVEVAQQNANELKAKVNIFQADMFNRNPEKDSYDIIVSNPPYIGMSEMKDMEKNVVDYEPHSALFVSEEDPLIYYRRVAEMAASGLKPGGRLYFEINPRYDESLRELLTKTGFENIDTRLDAHGRCRFVSCRKTQEEA